MRKLIHNLFEMDLSSTLLERVEENSYFSSNFFAKLTYPFEKNVNELDPQFIYHYNRLYYTKMYPECIWNEWGEIEEAKLYVLSSKGSIISFQIVTGFDNFPNFDKKLSELNLHHVFPDNLYNHAASLVGKTYPETDYTFPAIHTDLVNTDNSLFAEFKKTYNLYENGHFIQNSKDNNNRIINYNLIQPVVSLPYLLKKGIEDAGYSLEGNVLQHELIKKLWVFKANAYSSATYPDSVEWLINKSNSRVQKNYYKNEQEIPFNGTFRITGKAYLLGWGNIFRIRDLFTGKIIWEPKTSKNTENVDFTITTTKDTVLEFSANDPGAGFTGEKILELRIIPITILDDEGKVINPNFDSPEIDLRKYVPDITFGDLIKAMKNTFNLDLYRKGKVIHMNFIDSNVKDYSNIKNLNEYEVLDPVITFNDAISFLLKFQYEDEQYPFDSLYVDKSGAKTSSYEELENTNEVNSPVIPLPRILRNNTNSAKYLTDDGSYLPLIIYTGLVNGKNESQSNSSLLWPQLYTSFWKEWLKFRIFSESFTWEFTAPKEKMKDLDVKTKIHAYNRTHIIKKITRSDLSENVEHIELDTYSE